MFKEDVTPAAADKPLYLLAPVLALLPAFTTFVVIPFGPDLVVNGRTVPLVVANVATGVLLFLALSSLGVYSLVMAGYASNNKFSLLGAVRASAQLISYELALTLAVLAVLIPAGSFRLSRHRRLPAEPTLWNFIPQFIGFLVFLVASFAETNRLPFDLPEAESELVAGFHTEYGAMRFALFFHGRVHEHGGAVGARRDALLRRLEPAVASTSQRLAGRRVVGLATLLAKVGICMAVFVWVRWTFPRFRYDQLMRLGWKVLLPLAILNLIVVAAMTLAGWL